MIASEKLAGRPVCTVALAVESPFTVNEKLPLPVPLMVPAPTKEAVRGDDESELLTVNSPVETPAIDGAKDTERGHEEPGASVEPQPVVVANPAVAAMSIRVTAVPLVLSSVVVNMLLLPTGTLPKFTVFGVSESCGGSRVPVPVSATISVVAELCTVTVPAAMPVPVGENVTSTGQVE